MSDPRLAIIDHRLEGVGRILAFASGKGGVGKSCCSTTAALLFARRGLKTGLLDLDFHGASDHIILGIEPELPGESGGILPIEAPFGLRYMGITPFTGEEGVALRGDAVTDAIRELLAVVVWGELDVLVVDMPPGIGEAILDLFRHVSRSEALLVSTPSALSLRVTERLVGVLDAGRARLAGYLLNMVPASADGSSATRPALPARIGSLPLLGEIPYRGEIEGEIGSPEALLAGVFAQNLERALGGLL